MQCYLTFDYNFCTRTLFSCIYLGWLLLGLTPCMHCYWLTILTSPNQCG